MTTIKVGVRELRERIRDYLEDAALTRDLDHSTILRTEGHPA